MTTTTSSAYNPSTEWFTSCGFSEIEPGRPTGYAQRLIRYIRDPSTVRARTLDRYGSAPSVESIRRWREDWVHQVKSRKATRWPEDRDDMPDENASWHPVTMDEISAAVARSLAKPIASPRKPHPVPRQRAVAKTVRPAPPIPTDVIARCAERLGVTVEEIMGKSRKLRFVRPRQFIAGILRARGSSYPNVGRFLGGMDHSTVIHSVRVLFDVGMRDPAYIAAWMAEAPCAMKFVRSVEELDLLLEVRR